MAIPMTVIAATKAKNLFLELLRAAEERGEEFQITRNGTPVGVLVSAEEWESLIETVELLSDRRTMRKLARAKAEMQRGRTYTHKEVWGKNGLPTPLPAGRAQGSPRSGTRGRSQSAKGARKASRRPSSR